MKARIMSVCRIDFRPARNLNRNAPIGYGSSAAQGLVVGGGIGRWPSNIIHDGSDEVLAHFPDTSPSSRSEMTSTPGSVYGGGAGLPSHTGVYGFDDSGSAARFFYCAKASQDDRNEGCESLEPRRKSDVYGDGLNSATKLDPRLHTAEGVAARPLTRNIHPTVKPTELMRYLCRLITPPSGIVLDPFTGSGSTGKAAMLEGLRFIGIELSEDYCRLAQRRIEAVTRQGMLFT